MFVDVRYFQLGAIDIPDALDESFLNALILNASAEREGFIQEAHIVRKETEQKVRSILQATGGSIFFLSLHYLGRCDNIHYM